MEITKILNGEILTISLNGRLDTTTAGDLETFLNENLSSAKELIMDCENLSYISSAGLRVLLSAKKKINNFKLLNVKDLVMEVFEITGFVDILTIE